MLLSACSKDEVSKIGIASFCNDDLSGLQNIPLRYKAGCKPAQRTAVTLPALHGGERAILCPA